MDLDQQAEQAQQKQGVPASMQGSLQGQPDPYSQGTRGYQSNPTTAGVAYTTPSPSNNTPIGRGGLVTYPLPASGTASNPSNPSSTFASSGGRGGHAGGQSSRAGYSTQAQSQATPTDYSYAQQGHFSYSGSTMQTQLQYAGQQSNPYSTQQGQGQSQGQYTTQQQPYY